MSDVYDVAVVGAGPAGAAVATYLARAGQRVVVLERKSLPRDKPCAEYLSPAAEPLLRDLGVLDDAMIRPNRLLGFRIFAPNGRMLQGDFAAARDARGRSLFESGLVIPRLRLDPALVAAARGAGAEVREGWPLARFEREDRDGPLTLYPVTGATDSAADGAVRARLLIAADGVHSTVARRLNLRRPGRMRKVALVAHVRGVGGLTRYGEMHVAGRRYVGLAPMEPDGDLCNVAMVVDQRRDGQRLAGRPQEFLVESLATFPGLRGRVDRLTVERRTLTTSGLAAGVQRHSAAGVLLVGDAGGYYDPFTGEGIYRALRCAQLATEVALPALARGDLGANALGDYDRRYAEVFHGKRLVEMIIQSAVQIPPLMNHIAGRLERRKAMADTIVAVTGDILSPGAVLNPGYLRRLVV